MLLKIARVQILSAHTADAALHDGGLARTAHRADFSRHAVRPGFLYVRSRAISSRCNDNFDEFPADEIAKAYKTFIGKPVFVNHVNGNTDRARGVIIDAALHRDHNPDGTPDTWVEVLMEVDGKNFPKLATALLAKPPQVYETSMGCDVEYSICSACGNKATRPEEYCRHIPAAKGTPYATTDRKTGARHTSPIREICYGLRFFENSLLVEAPADPTAQLLGIDASGLGKTARVEKTALPAGLKFRYRPPEAHSNGMHEVQAWLPDSKGKSRQVGYFTWHPQHGYADIMMIPDRAHRGQGISDALWQRAHEIAAEHNLVTPTTRGSIAVSPEGRRWMDRINTSGPHLPISGEQSLFDRPAADATHIWAPDSIGADTDLAHHLTDPRYHGLSGIPADWTPEIIHNTHQHAHNNPEFLVHDHHLHTAAKSARYTDTGPTCSRCHHQAGTGPGCPKCNATKALKQAVEDMDFDGDGHDMAWQYRDTGPTLHGTCRNCARTTELGAPGMRGDRPDLPAAYSAPCPAVPDRKPDMDGMFAHTTDYLPDMPGLPPHLNSRTAASTDGYITCGQGHEHWGTDGAAGMLIHHDGHVLLGRRANWVQHGGTWGIPGGALHEGEGPEQGAHREATEELGDLPSLRHTHIHHDDHGGWQYSTVIAEALRRFHPEGGSDGETDEFRWVHPRDFPDYDLHPGLAASWPHLAPHIRGERRTSDRRRVEGVSGDDTSYRFHHTAPDSTGTPLHKLLHPASDRTLRSLENGRPADEETGNAIEAANGRPRSRIKIYRAVPSHITTFNPGDWVALSSAFAQDFAEHRKDHHVIAATAEARHLHTDGNDALEWGYNGPAKNGRIHWRRSVRSVRPDYAGGAVQLSPEDHDFVHGTAPVAERAHRLMQAIPRWSQDTGPYSTGAMHSNKGSYTNDRSEAHYDAQDNADNLPHADRPPTLFMLHAPQDSRAITGISFTQHTPPETPSSAYTSHTWGSDGIDEDTGMRHTAQTSRSKWWEAYSGDSSRAVEASAACPHCGEPSHSGYCTMGRVRTTDWSKVPHFDEIHRGFPVHLGAEDHAAVHDPDRSPTERGAHLLGVLRDHSDSLGSHWSTDQHFAHDIAQEGWGADMSSGYEDDEQPDDTHVVVHARFPERHHIETDPEALRDGQVFGWNHHTPGDYPAEHEVPLKYGAPVHVTGISYKHADDDRWTHAHFGDDMTHTAALQLQAMPPRHTNPAEHPFFKEHPVSAENVIAHWAAATPEEKSQGERWYSDAHLLAHALAHTYAGGDTGKAAGVISAYSPRTSWAANMHNAARSLATGKALKVGEGLSIMGVHHSLADKIMNGEHYDTVLKGPKTNAFAKLIHHGGIDPLTGQPMPHVVIDRHALSVAAGQRLSEDDAAGFPSSTPHYYNHVAKAYEDAAHAISKAENRTVAPHQVQATTWLVRIRHNQAEDRELRGGGGKGRVKNQENQLNQWRELHPKLLPGGAGQNNMHMSSRYEYDSPTGWRYNTSIRGRVKTTSPEGAEEEHWTSLIGNGLTHHRHPQDMPVPLYHGTPRQIPEGGQIEPGHPGNFVRRMKHVYMVEDPDIARRYAGPDGHVYQVQPTGWYGHRSDATAPNWASESPLDIVGLHSGPRDSRTGARRRVVAMRQVTPEWARQQGISPQDEWHGPYEVVQAGDRFHVLDNADRHATVLGAVHGWPTAEHAQNARDHIDQRRVGKERAKALGESLFGAANDILGDGADEDTRRLRSQNDQAMALRDRFPEHESDGRHGFDETGAPYYEVQHPQGWHARYYGGQSFDIHHPAVTEHAVGMQGLSGIDPHSYGTPEGLDSHQLHRQLHQWVDENGADHARQYPQIEQWNRRRRASKTAADDDPFGLQEWHDADDRVNAQYMQHQFRGAPGRVTTRYGRPVYQIEHSYRGGRHSSGWYAAYHPDSTEMEIGHHGSDEREGQPITHDIIDFGGHLEPHEITGMHLQGALHHWVMLHDREYSRANPEVSRYKLRNKLYGPGSLAQEKAEAHAAQHGDGIDYQFGLQHLGINIKLAYGETKAPAQVDTLRDDECDVCGNKEGWDGQSCPVCLYQKPPSIFTDPDTSVARTMDLRGIGDAAAQTALDQGADAVPGGLDQSGQQLPGGDPANGQVPGGVAEGPGGEMEDPRDATADVDVQTLGDGDGTGDPAATEADGQTDVQVANGQGQMAPSQLPPGAQDVLTCPNCGFQTPAGPPVSSITDDPSVPASAGPVAGDVCPNCGKAVLVSSAEEAGLTPPPEVAALDPQGADVQGAPPASGDEAQDPGGAPPDQDGAPDDSADDDTAQGKPKSPAVKRVSRRGKGGTPRP